MLNTTRRSSIPSPPDLAEVPVEVTVNLADRLALASACRVAAQVAITDPQLREAAVLLGGELESPERSGAIPLYVRDVWTFAAIDGLVDILDAATDPLEEPLAALADAIWTDAWERISMSLLECRLLTDPGSGTPEESAVVAASFQRSAPHPTDLPAFAVDSARRLLITVAAGLGLS